MKTKYNSQKCAAKKRGIEWYFTFDTWLAWWGNDIINRGRRKGQLVMARKGDQGPYHPDNVYKATTKENQNEWRCGQDGSHTVETRIKISKAKKGIPSPFKNTKPGWNHFTKSIHTPFGDFSSKKEAVEVSGLDISYYLRTRPSEYFYL